MNNICPRCGKDMTWSYVKSWSVKENATNTFSRNIFLCPYCNAELELNTQPAYLWLRIITVSSFLCFFISIHFKNELFMIITGSVFVVVSVFIFAGQQSRNMNEKYRYKIYNDE
jgi:hypothetical protein